MSGRLLLTDDHRMFREALRLALSSDPELRVVAEAGSGAEALAALARTAVDLAIVDIGLPDMSGIELAREIAQRYPAVGVIALSGYGEKVFVDEMLKAGARAFVVKSAGADELLLAIRAVAGGGVFLSPEITAAMLPGQRLPGSPPPRTVLGRREQAVLTLLASGLRSAEIGERLGIAPATVDVHRRNLKKKLGLSSVAELTRYAIREGLIQVR